MTIPFNAPTNPEKPQLTCEMMELKSRMTDLFGEITAMKNELRSKQEQYYKARLRFEQLDREQAERRVKRVSYSGPRKTSKPNGDDNAYALIARLTPTQQAELLAALR